MGWTKTLEAFVHSSMSPILSTIQTLSAMLPVIPINRFKIAKWTDDFFSGTFTGLALDHALTVSLSESNGNRPDVPDLMLLLTDGRAADDVKTPADSLRAAGVQVSIGMSKF